MAQDLVLSALKDQSLLTQADVEILGRSKFKGFEDHEIAYAIKIASALRLNPMLNQIHFVKRKNKDGSYSVTAQVGIDGFRLTAQRAGGYAGSDDAAFEVDSKTKKPTKALVTVYRIVEGQKCSFTASARWEEYYNPIGGQWDRMPYVMLGKCAEALALRKAFPAELSSVYSPEELDRQGAPTKAQDIESKVKGEPIEVESEVMEPTPSEPMPGSCRLCGAAPEKVINSKRNASERYCFACQKSFPKEGAA